MMYFSPLQFHFIRSSSQQYKDDVLTIVPTNSYARIFDVTYEDRSVGARNHLVAGETEVLDFVESIFDLMPVDDDPFESVQITCPSFPSVLLRVRDIGESNIQASIWRLIKNTLKNWPAQMNRETDPLRYANNLTA